MRNIKFRAWDKRNNRMCPVADISFGHDGAALTIMAYLAPRMNYADAITGSIIHSESGVLMQFTGEYDDAGCEIYEGDILGVNRRDDQSKVIIVFRNATFKAELVGNPGVYDKHWTFAGSRWIVIGNRYENPELLENRVLEEP